MPETLEIPSKSREVLDLVQDALTVRRVFGDPIERDGLVLVPVASVHGVVGAGSGLGDSPARGGGRGGGAGWVADVRPAGAYVINGSAVSWRPAVDVNRLLQIALVAGLFGLSSALRRRRRRRR